MELGEPLPEGCTDAEGPVILLDYAGGTLEIDPSPTALTGLPTAASSKEEVIAALLDNDLAVCAQDNFAVQGHPLRLSLQPVLRWNIWQQTYSTPYDPDDPAGALVELDPTPDDGEAALTLTYNAPAAFFPVTLYIRHPEPILGSIDTYHAVTGTTSAHDHDPGPLPFRLVTTVVSTTFLEHFLLLADAAGNHHYGPP